MKCSTNQNINQRRSTATNRHWRLNFSCPLHSLRGSDWCNWQLKFSFLCTNNQQQMIKCNSWIFSSMEKRFSEHFGKKLKFAETRREKTRRLRKLYGKPDEGIKKVVSCLLCRLTFLSSSYTASEIISHEICFKICSSLVVRLRSSEFQCFFLTQPV